MKLGQISKDTKEVMSFGIAYEKNPSDVDGLLIVGVDKNLVLTRKWLGLAVDRFFTH